MDWTPRVLEVCVTSAADARAAVLGDADRLELNVALELGGLTPDVPLLKQVLETVRDIRAVPVVVMIRPRAGGFCYDADELLLMHAEAEALLDAGANGIVFGVLTREREVDAGASESLAKLAVDRGADAVFHRAVDVCRQPVDAVSRVIEAGCNRILSSGGAATALEGVETLRRMHDAAAGRIAIMAGAGLRAENLKAFAASVPIREFHGSFRKVSLSPDDYRTTDQCEVMRARLALDCAEE